MLLQDVYKVEKGTSLPGARGRGRRRADPLQLGAAPRRACHRDDGLAAKIRIAEAAGAHEVLDYRAVGFVDEVHLLTGGKGVNVAYDAVGRDTFQNSLACLATFGMLVNYGQASGPVEPISPSALAAKSNSLTRPIIFHWLRDPAIAKRLSTSLFAAIDAGIVRPQTSLTLSHRALEQRRTAGSVVLTV